MPALFDTLESRTLFAAVAPSAFETYLVELINRARANPVLEGQRFGIDINEGLNTGQITTTPKQPLAINGFLDDSSGQHATYVLINGQISLVGAGGTLPAARMVAAGFAFTGTAQGSAENVGAIVQNTITLDQAMVAQLHRNLFVDNGINGRVDRANLMAESFTEIGPGITAGDWNIIGGGGGGGGGTTQQAAVVVEDFALATANTGGDVFLCGVAYNDTATATAANNFYDVGEGLGNVTISARRLSDNQVFTTTSYGSGAYSLRLLPGTYDVIASGNSLGGSVRYPAVVVGSKNVKRDFTSQQVTTTIPNPNPGGLPPIGESAAAKAGDIRGKIYIDDNGDGFKDSKDANGVLKGIKVYADTNGNGVIDSTDSFGVTQANGAYNITGLRTGIYKVMVGTPDGYRVSRPTSDFQTVKVFSKKLAHVRAFLITQRTLIAGQAYRDDNQNGSFDTTVEKTLSNWRVFVDLNNDGIWQRETELATKTDKQGKYGFRDLFAGTYVVRILPKVGYIQTQPGSNLGYTVSIPAQGLGVTGLNFGQRRIASQGSNSSLRSGLASVYLLNEATGPRADAVGGRTLTPVNAVTRTTGLFGSAAQFDKSASQALVGAGLTRTSQSMTWAAWVKPTTTTGANGIFSNSTLAGSINYNYLVRIDDGTFIAYVGTDSFDSAGITFPNDGAWHLAIAVLDRTAGTLSVYLDGGASNNTVPYTRGDGTNTGASFSVGGSYGGTAEFFNGSIEQPAVWNRALTSTERAELWNAGRGLGLA